MCINHIDQTLKTGEEEKKKWEGKAGTPFRDFGRTRE